ncbi:hypothetical protein D9M68_530440 [compost metagenome]
MQKFTLHLKKSSFFWACFIVLLFSAFDGHDENAAFIQQTLNRHYNSGAEGAKVKRYELNVTNTGFCKYKKVYANGKTEFFSFNLLRFKSMEYYGNVNSGELHLFTNNDDVIVQTHNDRKGDIDTMAMQMVIPLKEVNAELLNALANGFREVNKNLMTVK